MVNYQALREQSKKLFLSKRRARSEHRNACDALQRGRRDPCVDCNQVCIAFDVTRCGMHFGYEVFGGNPADVTSV